MKKQAKQQHELSDFAAQAPIGIYRADPGGRITYINPALEAMTGVPVGRALGANWLQSAPAERRTALEAEWQAAIAAGENWRTEFRFTHRDGSARYVLILMTANRNETGAVTGFVGYVSDITEQRTAQADLRRSERLFRSLAENASDIIVRLDLDDHVIYASPAMEEITGFTADETRGINPVSFMHPDDAPAAKELTRRLKASEIEQAVIQYRTPHKDGRYIWVEARSRVIRSNEGLAREVISVVRDISDHKRLQADLIAAREAENQASQAQSRFLATMSHEIRTPISGVIGMIDLLINSPDDGEQPRYRAALANSARTLLRVVDDVLDYSRLNSVGITLDQAPFDVFATVHSVADLYRPAAAEKKLILGLEFDATSRFAVGDAARLSQVLGNLVSNALKFTEKGRIDIKVLQRKDRWSFSVTDTGIGLSVTQQAVIFTAFVQADHTITSRFGGSGLGLAIAQRIVAEMGGSISVQSSLQNGARFTFDAVLPPAVARWEPPQDENSKLIGNRSLDVLIADDSEVNLLYFTRLLEDLGHRVTAVADGVEAVAAARRRRYDAILLDRQMPNMGGDEAAILIRQMDRGGTCLLVEISAASTIEPVGGTSSDNIYDAVLPKPVRPKQLAQVLAACEPLVTQSDTAMRADLARLFRVDLNRRLPILRSALSSADEPLLQREAHAIAGGAALLGEYGIESAARAVEGASPSAIVRSSAALIAICAHYLADGVMRGGID